MVLLLFFFLLLFDFLHFCIVILVEAQNVVEVPVVDVHLLVLLFDICILYELDMDLGALLEAVMLKRPARDDAESYFSAFKGDDKAFSRLSDFFFQILKELSGVLGLLDVYPLSFGLENSVFVDKNETHFYFFIWRMAVQYYGELWFVY